MPSERYHHDNLKQALIKRGLDILDTEGYEGLSLRKVAKACGVSQTAPYRHFADKDALVAAITHQAMAAFGARLAEAATFAEEPRTQLKHIGVAYVRFFAENPAYLRLLFLGGPMTKAGHDEQPCGENLLVEGHPFATFFHAVERYASQHPAAPFQRDELVLYCWGLVHGLAVLMNSQETMHFGGMGLDMIEHLIWDESFLP